MRRFWLIALQAQACFTITPGLRADALAVPCRHATRRAEAETRRSESGPQAPQRRRGKRKKRDILSDESAALPPPDPLGAPHTQSAMHHKDVGEPSRTTRTPRPRSLRSLLRSPALQAVIPAAAAVSTPQYTPTRTAPLTDASRGNHPRPPSSTPSVSAAYEAVMTHSFMNPFSGKITACDSSTYRQLEALGFSVDPEKPLHLRWRRSDLEGVYAAQEQGGTHPEQGRPQQKGASADGAPLSSVPDPGGQRQDCVAAALPKLLKPFQGATKNTKARTELDAAGLGVKGWRAMVISWFARDDYALAIPTLLQQRYEDWLSAYMPPKLDAVPDPATADVVLTQDQKNTLTLAQRGFHLFIGGSAGTGKTVLLKVIFRELSQRGLRVAVTATTGVAAVQLGGCTFHSAFEVPVTTGVAGSRRPRWDANALRAVDVVIVDEVSLLNAQMLDAFDAEARLARLSTAPFGGLHVILCGDFLQLSHDAAVDALPAYLSAAFQHVVAVQLMTPMRQRHGDPLLGLLQQLRQGEFDQPLFAQLERPIPADTQSLTYIFPRRREAHVLNDVKLCELHTEEMTCTPQRGPLELVGAFTESALIELPDAVVSLPSRLTVLGMVQESLEGLLKQKNRGGCVYVPLPESDVVVMPSAAHVHGRLAFLLRVRLEHGSSTRPAHERQRQEPHNAHAVAQAGLAVPPCSSDQPLSEAVTSAPPRASAAYTVQFIHATSVLKADPGLWRTVCERVTALLKGRLVTLYPHEPTNLVPLHITSTLADLTRSSEVAEALRPLRLKLGCRVMVNRNLSRTVSNGSVGVVEAFLPPDLSLFPRRSDKSNYFAYHRLMTSKPFSQLPVVRLLSGEVVQVPPQVRMLGGTAATHYYGHEVFSVPLQLGYGFTVHKVQGLTLSGTVVLDCEHFFECPHLLYVACSRVRSIDQLVVRHVKPEMLIIKRSALDFSRTLTEARDPSVLSPPLHMPRAAWTDVLTPRVFSMSE